MTRDTPSGHPIRATPHLRNQAGYRHFGTQLYSNRGTIPAPFSVPRPLRGALANERRTLVLREVLVRLCALEVGNHSEVR